MSLLTGVLEISSLCQDAENCLSWLIILLDIFAIFYLVFVSFYKVTKFVRMLGWIWVGVLVTADVMIMAMHPCILTLLCVLFTIMIITAVLSVVLPNVGYVEQYEPKEEKEKSKQKAEGKVGSYVIRKADEGKYCFELYDKQDKYLVRSFNCYKRVEDVKEAIANARTGGVIADVEDRTVSWIKEINHPKFEIYQEGGHYYFRLSLDSKDIVFVSEPFALLKDCKKQLDKTVAAVGSTAVYISIEKLTESQAQQYKGARALGDTAAAASGLVKARMVEVAVTSADAERPPKPAVKPKEPKTVIATIEPKKSAVKPQEPPKPAAEEKPSEGETAADGAIVINPVETKTLRENYKELSDVQKKYFDGLKKAAQAKEGAREYESSEQISYALFRDKLMRIRIRRNTVEAIFMLMDPTFKQMQSGSDVKIKETKTVLKIENDTYYALALETLDKKYDLLVKQKEEREARKKQERLERSRQKRLENKA